MVDITPNKLSTRILNGLRHASLASENFTANIFSPCSSVFPGFRCKANLYYALLKSAKRTIYITNSALNFSVSHKASSTRIDGITVIIIPRDLKHVLYFLVKLFRKSVFYFVR